MSAFEDFAINFNVAVFKPLIIDNGYSVAKIYDEDEFDYTKGGFLIEYANGGYIPWFQMFYLSGSVDIPMQYVGVSVEELIRSFELYAPLMTPQLINQKTIDDTEVGYVSYYLGDRVYDCYFSLDLIINEDKLDFEIGVYENPW